MSKVTRYVAVIAILGCINSFSPVESKAVFDRKFENCKALNKVYPGGVAQSSKWVNKGGNLSQTPTVNPKVYAANKGKDRDKDGLACEN